MPTQHKFIVYTDGACSGNPGPGGYGVIVIENLRSVYELGAGEVQTTNNRMELQAVIVALDFILSRIQSEDDEVQIYTDSVYVIRGATKWVFGWKKNQWKNAEGEPVANREHWKKLSELIQKIPAKIKWHYVRGHNGDPGNERCDRIAVAFSKNDHIDLFQGKASNYIFDVTVPARTEPLPESQHWKKTNSEKKNSWYLSLINGVVTKYPTWTDCEAQVKGRPGVKFKKVSSEEEEKELLKSWGK